MQLENARFVCSFIFNLVSLRVSVVTVSYIFTQCAFQNFCLIKGGWIKFTHLTAYETITFAFFNSIVKIAFKSRYFCFCFQWKANNDHKIWNSIEKGLTWLKWNSPARHSFCTTGGKKIIFATKKKKKNARSRKILTWPHIYSCDMKKMAIFSFLLGR